MPGKTERTDSESPTDWCGFSVGVHRDGLLNRTRNQLFNLLRRRARPRALRRGHPHRNVRVFALRHVVVAEEAPHKRRQQQNKRHLPVLGEEPRHVVRGRDVLRIRLVYVCHRLLSALANRLTTDHTDDFLLESPSPSLPLESCWSPTSPLVWPGFSPLSTAMLFPYVSPNVTSCVCTFGVSPGSSVRYTAKPSLLIRTANHCGQRNYHHLRIRPSAA